MEHRITVNLLSTAAIIALGVVVSLVTSTVVASKAYRARGEQAVRREQIVNVKGFAWLGVRSDLGPWQIDVSDEDADLQSALEYSTPACNGCSSS